MLSQRLIYYWQEIYLFGFSIRQWSHPLMIPLRCLWAKSNSRMHGQFECNMTWFCFCFDFVCSHTRCGCCSIVCWRGWVRRRGVRLNLDVQCEGGGKVLDVDVMEGRGSWKLDNFHGRHMCIVPFLFWKLDIYDLVSFIF